MGVGAPCAHFDVTFSTEGIGVPCRNGLIQTLSTTGELGTEHITFPVLISSVIPKTESSILMIHRNFHIITHKLYSIPNEFRHTNNKYIGLLN